MTRFEFKNCIEDCSFITDSNIGMLTTKIYTEISTRDKQETRTLLWICLEKFAPKIAMLNSS